MGVNAYKVKVMELEDTPRFNLSYDDFITNLNIDEYANEDGITHEVVVYKDTIEIAIEDFENLWVKYVEEKKANEDPEVCEWEISEERKQEYKAILNGILEDMGEEDYISYQTI